MNIFKTLFIVLILLSTLFSYSNTCGSPLIVNFTTNRVNQNSALLRFNDVGSISTFSVRNLSTNELEIIQFELLATDGVSNFYGEVKEISNGNIDISIIQQLFQTFTLNTPDADSLNLQNGIKVAEEVMLGFPPSNNGNSNVNILFMDIRDGYSSSGEFVAGFFDPQDQNMCLHENGQSWQPESTEHTCTYPYEWTSNGNGLNIIYIDSNPSQVNQGGLENTLFTLAHEYQHLLHWNADFKEGYFGSEDEGWAFHNPWINEGLSDLMPSILGLGLRDFYPYFSNTKIGLDEWSEIGSSSTLPYYAKSALFFQYLYELEGLNLINDIFSDDKQGLLSIKSNYDDNNFDSLYVNWIKAIVMGELEISQLDFEVYAYNIANQFSMDLNNTSIGLEEPLPAYSFTLFAIPEYLSIENIEFNESLNLYLYKDGTFTSNENLTQEGVSVFEKIILYSKNILVPNISIDLSYKYIGSPNGKNLFIYPNPIRENIFSYTYFSNENNVPATINLFDLKGRRILTKEVFSDNQGKYKGNLSLDLSSGIYILQTVLASDVSESRLITIIK